MSRDAELAAIEASLAAALPARAVQRDLPGDPLNKFTREQLLAGVVCLVCKGGGNFSNTYGREGQQGLMQATLVGFLQVDEGAAPRDIETAELQLLDEILAWCGTGPFDPADDVLPIEWQQSEQLEHPFGWLLVRLDIRFP
jgi:hypothetical protein